MKGECRRAEKLFRNILSGGKGEGIMIAGILKDDISAGRRRRS